jgi:hypothetical protein
MVYTIIKTTEKEVIAYGKVKKKGGQKPLVTDWINTVCNILIALAALGTLAYMVFGQ